MINGNMQLAVRRLRHVFELRPKQVLPLSVWQQDDIIGRGSRDRSRRCADDLEELISAGHFDDACDGNRDRSGAKAPHADRIAGRSMQICRCLLG